jgi:hypothetical protein
MTDDRNWRSISPEESAVVTAIIEASRLPGAQSMIDELMGALVAPETDWIIDIKSPGVAAGADLPDGPFPARAFVPSSKDYRGEVIIWVKSGHLSGLEYAWITDTPPNRWPRPDEMEVVTQ